MIKSFLQSIRWHEACAVIRACGFVRLRWAAVLAFYYLLTIANALFDGVGLVLLVNLMTGKISDQGLDLVSRSSLWILRRAGGDAEPATVLLFIVALFTVRSALAFTVQAMDSSLNTLTRRRIQEHGFRALMQGEWEFLRDMRVGQRTGALTEEAAVVAKYITSLVRAGYALVTGVVLMLVALLISPQLTAIMIMTAIPAAVILQILFIRVARLARLQVSERQAFAADIAERLNGLFQIKVEGQTERHIADGLRHQAPMTALEYRVGFVQAGITAFNVVLPAIVLLEFAAWFAVRGESLMASINILGSVGIVGARAAAQFNSAEGSLGNLSRLSGSLVPVAALFDVKPEAPRAPVPEPVAAVNLRNVVYRYNDTAGVEDTSFTARVGRSFLIKGPSGAGKTTLANVIAGVYRPQSGTVIYEGASGREYDSREFRPLVGYVAQDIHLFHGNVRDNLVGRQAGVDDGWLWECLSRAGLSATIEGLGGLDGMIAEAGRSLSGGERRRLGIARVLVRRPGLLILDEVTAGLDEENRRGIISTIAQLSRELVMIIISHDPLDLPVSDEWDLTPGAPVPLPPAAVGL